MSIINILNPEDVPIFIERVTNMFMEDKDERTNDDMFQLIIEELKILVPPSGLSQEENIFIPAKLQEEGWNENNTYHVDSILFPNDDAIDEYCDMGIFHRYYCGQCGSKEILTTNFFTHSASIEDIKLIYDFIKSIKIENKIILDIGSRLGTLLYYGYFNTESTLIGIEKNNFFVEVENKIIKKFKLGDRIRIIENDIRNEKKCFIFFRFCDYIQLI